MKALHGDELSAIRVKVTDDIDMLAAHADAWDELATVGSQRLPMLSHAWVSSYLRHRLRTGERWLCALATDGERLVGVFPVLVRPHPLAGRRCPYLIGLVDDHTRSGDALVAPGNEQAVIPAMVTALLHAEPHPCALAFGGVRDGSPTLIALGACVDDLMVLPRRHTAGSLIRPEGRFEDFRAGLSPNFKGNLRKARNKLTELPDVESVFVVGAEATEAGLDWFLPLEASGWKGGRGTAIAMSAPLESFYRELCRLLAERGWLEWHQLRTGGKAIAGHLAIRLGDSVSLIKIAYDEDYSRYAPVKHLIERCIERTFEDDGVHQLNCLTDMPWHRNWQMVQDQYRDLWLFPRSLPGLLLGLVVVVLEDRARESLGPALRRLGKRVAGRQA